MLKKWNKKLDKIGRNLDKEVSKSIGLENGVKMSGLSSSVDAKRKETENQFKTLLGKDEEIEEITNGPEGHGNLSSNEEERIEDLTAEAIIKNKVEETNTGNNSEINTTNKVNSLAKAVREYVESRDTNSELKSIIEDILFQSEQDEVSYADLCQTLFILQDEDLTGMIVDFTTSYEV